MHNNDVSKLLGKQVKAPEQYDKSILVRELRDNNRQHLGIAEGITPFQGVDIWNCWEVSALTDGGVPVVAIVKLVYPCNSKYIVESKSLKLFLNSFNMTKVGYSTEMVLSWIELTVGKDLSELLETHVKVSVFTLQEYQRYQ